MKKVTFKKNEAEIKLMAIYLAELTKEGIAWYLNELGNNVTGEWFEVHITGF